MDKKVYEKIYEKPCAVWTSVNPPEELIKLVEKGIIKPCKVLDVACGEGFYSIYLAKKGFDVMGIDLSEKAIEYAKENAKKAGVNIIFKAMDVMDLAELKEKFDFVLEWALLHCLARENWQNYINNVSDLLNEKGKYLSVCFNIDSPEFGGPGKNHRMSPMNTKMYYSTQNELKTLFEQHFKILESKLITLPGKNDSPDHITNYFLMEK